MIEWWEVVLLLVLCAAPILLFGATKLIARAWFAAKREHTRQMLREFNDDNRGGPS